MENNLIGDEYIHPFFSVDSEMKTPQFKEKIKYLSRTNVFASGSQILLEYIGIALVILCNIIYPNVWLYLPSIMFIGSRMHGLYVILHDASHYRLCSNKKINDWICHLFISSPLFINFNYWRSTHFSHHKHTGGEKDPERMSFINSPEYKLPMNLKCFLIGLFQHIFGIKYIIVLFSKKRSIKDKIVYIVSSFYEPTRVGPPNINNEPVKKYTKAEKTIISLFYITIFSSIIYFGWIEFFILFWISPLILWIHFIGKIRTYTEHFGLKHDGVYEYTRCMYASWFDILFLGLSWNVGLHLDHHIFPSVPSYRLKCLHNILKNTYPYSKYAHITKNGVIGVIKECTN